MSDIDVIAYAMSQTYTDEEIAGGGAIKGKNCQIYSVTDITGGKRVTFKWYLDNGTEKTSVMDVMNGTKGEDGQQGEDGVGIESIEVDGTNLICVYTDGTQSDPIPIPTVAGEGVPSGGSAGQVLAKKTGSDYDTEWVTPSGGGGDSSLTSAVTSNLTVGAIASGTTLAQGTTFTDFVKKLLITEIAPTLTFSISKSGSVVYGSSYSETLTVNVSDMGTAKKIKSISWYKGGSLLRTDTIDSAVAGTWTYTDATAVTDSTSYSATITYTKSDDTDDSISKNALITFYYNKFYGAVDSINPSEATVEALTPIIGTGKGGTYSFTVTNGRICYAYPKSLGSLSTIKDGNGFSLFDSFTKTEQTYTQDGKSVVYNRYVLTDATTITSYTVTFA